MQNVVISGAAGAWGDSSLSTDQLLADGRSQYIVYEGLAEITMAILSRAKAKDPEMGYARDLIEIIARNLSRFRESGVKVITNAGGVNPEAAAAVIRAADSSVAIATVTGDDLMDTEAEPAGAISVNAYLGAAPIAAALDAGAEVVVTGRVVDSALVLGPLIHEFGWRPENLDMLSAGSLAGHLLECGPQSTGGLFTDWKETSSWANPGFPIAEVSEDGTFILTTPSDSDGIVTKETVAEQLLYEIGDPSSYMLPDVICDWTGVHLDDLGDNRVRVQGAVGRPPPTTLKACAQIPDGWRAQSLLFIGGRDAVAKAERVGRDLLSRGSSILIEAGLGDFRATDVEVLGAESTYGSHSVGGSGREVILKIGVHHSSREAVATFVREIPSIALAGPPGVSGGGAGLPHPSPFIRLECFPIPRGQVVPRVKLNDQPISFDDTAPAATSDQPPASLGAQPLQPEPEWIEVPLISVAHGRSGDKGADVNIGIRARHPEFLPFVRIPPEVVGEWLSHLGSTSVERFDLPGIDAVNYLLHGGLGSGGTASLRFDPQGKAIAQQLLDMPVTVPPTVRDHPAFHYP